MDEVKDISILEFLNRRGIRSRPGGKGRYFVSSPFNRDSTWSFCIYPTNTYFDWSSGHGGNIINLVSKLENISYTQAVDYLQQESGLERIKIDKNKAYEDSVKQEKFNYSRYLNFNEEETKQIQAYAASRGIKYGYYPGVYFTRSAEKDSWKRHPCLMFLHFDEQGQICGAKFRNLTNESPRFSARGKLCWLVLESELNVGYHRTPLYVVEGEINAISLWEHLNHILKMPATVVSPGGVANPKKYIPEKYKNSPIKIIIDYDGDEQLYLNRLKLYEHLNGTPIKLILQKGEDINTLYTQKKMYLIEHLLLN